MDELQRRVDNFTPPPPFTSDAGQLHQLPHEQTFKGEQNQLPGCHTNTSFSHVPPQSCQKRQFSRINGVDYGGFVKLYVSGIPRTTTEQEIDAVFGEHGHIVEIVLLKDKVTGLQQECCFVKYATIEQAEQAIWALHGQFTFGRGMTPITVKYADGERDRIGACNFSAHVLKLYVNYLNKQAQKWEIEEIFSPFGIIEDIYIIRDEFKQNRGCAFIQYSCRDMAIAAIEALHGSYVMRGCDQPLVVRFADPKKPRVDSRPTSYPNYPSSGNMMPNETQRSKSSYGGCKTTTTPPSTSSASAAIAMVEHPHPIECEWSEHISPDGELYYYNCVTCESRWEMPEEYELYEQEIDNKEQQQLPEMHEAQLV
ncbi:flowering time control protein FCA-like isoform X1 [Primulina tabacum]|uniref:flowering time control protein FCA-like isoform X1 n=1 Tax=Primulina tabacum TaxID=48773 RepID=UPI003F59A42C